MMKKSKINLFAIAATALALVTMSFKAAGSRAEITRWHLISAQGSNQQQDIVGAQTADPSQEGNCEESLENLRCAVEITYDESYNPVGQTVSTVESATGNPASGRTFKPED